MYFVLSLLRIIKFHHNNNFPLQEMVSMNHQLLDLIGVGHQSLTQVCRICRSHELNCKLTGSGGGGCAFAIIRPGEVNVMYIHMSIDHTYMAIDVQKGG